MTGSRRALIAMSGGVDSSVAAACMQERGFECIGITMKLYDNSDANVSSRTCCSLDDTEDARRVCERLGIDHYVSNFSEDFRRDVISRFLSDYSQGITPNPCIECNRRLKFDRLYRRAMELRCDAIVTGHYARVIRNGITGEYELHKGLDEKKDQSYVLYMLSHEVLAHTILPIGEMDKQTTRSIADRYGFVNAAKADSQDICFIPDGDHTGFLRSNGITGMPGDFIATDGTVLGRHTGICNYTYGQRRGLGIPAAHRLFVKEIRPETNEIVLADDDELYERELIAGDVCWTYATGHPAESEFRCRARIRYHHKEADAVVYVEEVDRIRVVFDEAQRAITPGQAVVLYDGSRVLGGGTILRT